LQASEPPLTNPTTTKETFLATNKTQAAKLLSAAEMEVFNASLAPAIKELGATRLASKVKRARTMRDKFRDLLQRQRVATRRRTGTKAGAGGGANERTAKKAEVFDEVLQRFSTRLEKVRVAAAREAARRAAAKAKERARAEKAAAAKAAKAAKAAAKGSAAKAATGSKSTVRGAVKAAVGKKAQAKRTAGKAPARSTKAPAVASRTAAGSSVGPGSQRARTAAKGAKLAAARERPIQGHLSSAVRRAQAKRDAKG
jgi:hypothetical protein